MKTPSLLDVNFCLIQTILILLALSQASKMKKQEVNLVTTPQYTTITDLYTYFSGDDLTFKQNQEANKIQEITNDEDDTQVPQTTITPKMLINLTGDNAIDVSDQFRKYDPKTEPNPYIIRQVKLKMPLMVIIGQKKLKDGILIAYYKGEIEIDKTNGGQTIKGFRYAYSAVINPPDDSSKKVSMTFLSSQLVNVDNMLYVNTLESWGDDPQNLQYQTRIYYGLIYQKDIFKYSDTQNSNHTSRSKENGSEGELVLASDEIQMNSQVFPLNNSNNSYILKRQQISVRNFSPFHNQLFRISEYVAQVEPTKLVELDYINLQELGQKGATFKKIKGLPKISDIVPNQSFTSMKSHLNDIFLGFTNTIVRMRIVVIDNLILQLLPNYLIKFKLENLSTQFVLQISNHQDLLFTEQTTNPDYQNDNFESKYQFTNKIQVVRWDTFDSPFNLVDKVITDASGAPKIVTSIDSSQFVILYLSNPIQMEMSEADPIYKNSIIIQRNTETQIFMEIPLNIPQNFYESEKFLYQLDNGNYLVVNLGSGKLSLVLIAQSVYLTTKNFTQDTKVEISASNRYQVQKQPINFNFKVVQPNQKFVALQPKEDVEENMNQEVSQKSLFVRSLPSSWFMGSQLNVDIKCEGLKTPVSVFQSEILANKVTNLLNADTKAINIFYYKFSPQPLDDGSHILLIQIDLDIYLKKCMLSDQNKLKCKVVFQDINSPKQQILESHIHQDKYLAYKTENGFRTIVFEGSNFQVLSQGSILSINSTCTQVKFQDNQYLFCLEYSLIQLVVFRILDSFQELFRVDGIYGTEIKTTELHSNFIYVMGEKKIDVIFYKTNELRRSITSPIIQEPDSNFIICSKYLISHSSIVNAYEIYDISDVNNIFLTKPPVSLTELGFTFAKNAKINSCSQYFPLTVRGNAENKILFVNLDEPIDNSIKTEVVIGSSSYYSSLFISGLVMRPQLSGISQKVVWSSLDTSNKDQENLGMDYEIFYNKIALFDFTKEDLGGQPSFKYSCTLEVMSQDQSEGQQYKFEIELLNESMKITTVQSNQTTIDKFGQIQEVLNFGPFESSKQIDLTTKFNGFPLVYKATENEDDYNQQIKIQKVIESSISLTSLMKSTRKDTSIIDLQISKSSSIYVLTESTLYKIKKGTEYFVSQFMDISLQNTDNQEYQCSKIYIYDERNMIWMFCSKANIPYLLLSNWNSLTPSVTLSQVLPFHDIQSIQLIGVNKRFVYILGFDLIGKVDDRVLNLQKFRLQVVNNIIQLENKSQDANDCSLLDQIPYFMKMLNYEMNTYAVYMAGSLSDLEKAQIVIQDVCGEFFKLAQAFQLVGLFQFEQRAAFSRIVNMDCFLDEEETEQSSSGSNPRIVIYCVIVQTTNMHFEVMLTYPLDPKDKNSKAEARLVKTYGSYGSFKSSKGKMSKKYIALLVSQANIDIGTVSTDVKYELSEKYVILFSRDDKGVVTKSSMLNDGVKIPIVYQLGGVPIQQMNDFLKVNIRFRDTNNGNGDDKKENEVLITQNSYYAITAVKISETSNMNITKQATTKNLTLTAINHYSESELSFIISDKFLFILTISASVFFALILLIIAIWMIIKKLRAEKLRTTLDKIQAGVFVDILKVNNLGEINLDELSIISSFRHSYSGDSRKLKKLLTEEDEKEEISMEEIQFESQPLQCNVIQLKINECPSTQV